MRVLVTGGSGFIGGYVTEQMVASGHTVAVADRYTYAGKAKNLAAVLNSIDLLIGDLSTGDLVNRIAAWSPTHVIHMAGETHVDRAIECPELFQQSNVIGTCRLLEALRRMPTPPRRIVVYSTDEVFGPTPAGAAFDESTPYRPSNAYSASKVGVEALATSFHITHGLPTVVVRPCNTYGPRQHPEKVIPKFIDQIASGRPITLYNDGKGSRDWLHAKDHARATETLMLHGIPGESYNLAAEDEHTDHQIYQGIVANLIEGQYIHKPPTNVTFVPGRPGHDRRYYMSGRKIRGLGWHPLIPFNDGFRETVLWNAEHVVSYWQDDVIKGEA